MAAQLPFPSTCIDKGFIHEPFAVFKPTFANYHDILELFRHITQQDLSHTSAVDAFCDQLSLHVEGVPLRSSSHGSEHAKRRNIWKKVQRKFDNYMQVLKKLRVAPFPHTYDPAWSTNSNGQLWNILNSEFRLTQVCMFSSHVCCGLD